MAETVCEAGASKRKVSLVIRLHSTFNRGRGVCLLKALDTTFLRMITVLANQPNITSIRKRSVTAAFSCKNKNDQPNSRAQVTTVQLVFNPFSQFVPQLELYSQLQLSLSSDHIAFCVPKST